jgi:hypothetical protein
MIAYARPPLALLLLAVLTLCGCGGSGGNQTTTTPPPTVPLAPTNLIATAGNAQVALTWIAPLAATSYDVERSSSNGGPYSSIKAGVMATNYTDKTATNGTTYYYDVYAVNSAGTTSAQPAQASATPQAPPQAPSNLTALPGNAVVSLSWSASAGAASYNVLRSTVSGGSYAVIASVVTTASYNDTSVSNGTTYYYAVQAVDAGGPSGNSNEVLATPSGEVQARVTANQHAFCVYKDADSGFNHGFPSGWFATPSSNLSTISLDAGCVDNPADTVTGCYPSTDTSALDTVHGTVLRFTFAAQPPGSYAGVNIEEPLGWASSQTGSGYNLQDVSSVTFDVRSPDGAQVEFAVGGCTTPYLGPLPSTWTTMTVAISSLACPPPLTIQHPDMSDVHNLFGVTVEAEYSPNGATVLLDNIYFTPVPARTTQAQEGETLSLPQSNQAFGVVAQPLATPPAPQVPFPPDQANRNFAAIYEAALSIQTLINQGDIANAQEVADALDYALYHDNQGDYLSTVPNAPNGCFSGAPANQCGLHDAYESGDIALLNAQGTVPGTAQAGDSRLAGFSCAPDFCIVQDTATGGNNAWALLALLDEYKASGNAKYLNDAITIGNWILRLADATGFGGYYVGYSQQGQITPPGITKTLNAGKSTENNADIFIAFMSLAKYDPNNATKWTSGAAAAGNFVMAMYDSQSGHFYNGTDPVGATRSQPGLCPYGATQGNDIININTYPDCDFLDSNTFTTLAMAGSPQYFNYQFPDGSTMDWRQPIQYALNTFPSTVTADGVQYQGFDIVPLPLMAADGTTTNGISWEFTGQVVETLHYVDQLYNQTTFETLADNYLAQMQQAQRLSPYGDGQGLVASTLQNGDALPPVDQCLDTPFDNCPPERVGLAATTWMILAEQEFNPLAGP